MYQRAGRAGVAKPFEQELRGSAAIVQVQKPRIARGFQTARAHAPNRPVAMGRRPDQRVDPVLRGDDHRLIRCGRVHVVKDNTQHRRNHQIAYPTGSRGETFGAGARAGQKKASHRCSLSGQAPGTGLCGLRPSGSWNAAFLATESMMTNHTAATLTVLGLESSCDDTAAAVLRADGNSVDILSNIVLGQQELHAGFGGVVPEIAARAHAEKLDLAVEAALKQAALDLSQIDAIAVTAGPGLIGGVMAGVMLAKGLAAATGKPMVGVNHLAGHALTPRLTDGIAFPYLMLLVSGGHCQFLLVDGVDEFTRLGGTIDDAPGEAFDKVAKLLGLGQPGGPLVEAEARTGDPKRFALPRPLLDRPDCDMSFSGLKTAVLRARDGLVAAQGGLYAQDRADICASFQAAMADVLAEKTRRALVLYMDRAPQAPVLAVAGGVAANQSIRAALERVGQAAGVRFLAPPLKLCTDNAAMIAWAGIERLRMGARDDLTLAARPRWPLDTTSAPMLGAGKKGAKA